MPSLPSFRLPDVVHHTAWAVVSGSASASIGHRVSAEIVPEEHYDVLPLMAAGAIGGACIAAPAYWAIRLGPPPNEILRFARDLVTAAAAAATGPAIGALVTQAVGLPLVDPLVALVIGCTGAGAICAFSGGIMFAATLAQCVT